MFLGRAPRERGNPQKPSLTGLDDHARGRNKDSELLRVGVASLALGVERGVDDFAWLYSDKGPLGRIVPDLEIVPNLLSGLKLDNELAQDQLGMGRGRKQECAQGKSDELQRLRCNHLQTTFPTDAKSFLRATCASFT